MDNKNSVVIIGLLGAIVGLLLGYFLGTNALPYQGMGEYMYGEEIIDSDGAMLHAMDEMMLGFRGVEGGKYEEAFLRGMIVHHLGAIAMAQELLKQTERPELIKLANDIITSQSAEVEMMKKWLSQWFPKS